ncbi:MAG: hypothetical protein HYX47_14665 [Burkholderiales bacterium]|nr:hypothetical protein [Burkholderiales bacterium]
MATGKQYPEMQGNAESWRADHQAKTQLKQHNNAIHEAAEKRTRAGVLGSGDATKIELDRVATLIEQESGCVLVKANNKDEESALRKLKDDLEGHWLDLRDLARCTLAATDEVQLAKVITVLRRILVTSDGFSLAKDVHTKAADDPCGYSGYNFVVRFGTKKPEVAIPQVQHPVQPLPNGKLMHAMTMSEDDVFAHLRNRPVVADPAHVGRFGEIQVNTYAMMYAKMSQKQFESMFGKAKWNELFNQTGIQGGVGHIFYEVWRVDKGSDAGKAVAELSKRYYRRMRMEDIRPSNPPDQLKGEIDQFCETHKGDAH